MGEDRHGNLFWYFGGIHLYRESKPSGNWEVVAKTRDQWRTLRDSFQDSSDKAGIYGPLRPRTTTPDSSRNFLFPQFFVLVRYS